jgi:hypothetical protein
MKRTMLAILATTGLALSSLALQAPRVHADDFIGPKDVNLPVQHYVAPPTEPDLVAVGISGPSTLKAGETAYYTATIRNDGTATPVNSLQVILDFNLVGPGNGGITQSPSSNNFFCVQDNFRFLCQGGTLAAGEQVTITFPVESFGTAGSANVYLYVNENRAVTESNYYNDYAMESVTVTK